MSNKKQGTDYLGLVRSRNRFSPKAVIGGLEQQSKVFREAADRSTALQQEGADYGFVDWAKDNYVKLQENRTATERDATVGKYARAKEGYEQSLSDEQNFNAKLEYININQGLASGTIADPVAAKRRLKELSDVIIDKDGSFDSRIISGISTPFIKGLEESKKKQQEFKSLMESSVNEYKEWDKENKKYTTIGTTGWFDAKEKSTELSLLNSDSWLYRASGLIGSSMSSWKEQLAGVGFGLITSIGAGMLAAGEGAAVGSSGGPYGALAGGLITGIGTAGTVWANYASRQNESSAEVAQSYKSKFLEELSKNKTVKKDAVLTKAKQKMVSVGMAKSIDDISDDSAVDAIITDQIQIKDNEVNTLRIKATKGLEDVYNANMALSYSDYAQSAIQFLPVGKLIGKLGGTASRLSTKVAPGLTKGLTKAADAVNKQLDDVIEFGLSKNVSSLASRRNRHAIASVLGKTVTTGLMEGAEEGTQYIVGQKYMQGKYDDTMNPVQAFMENMWHGARATYAALTPFDPVYSSDKEFLENYKGGVMLGGLMTGVTTGGMATVDRVRQNKYDKLASALYADHIAAKDDVITGAMYSKEARTGSVSKVVDGLSSIKEAGYEDVDNELIDESIKQAKGIQSLVNSKTFNDLAKKANVKKDSDRFDIFASLYNRTDRMLKDAITSSLKANSKLNTAVTELINNATVDEGDVATFDYSNKTNELQLNAYLRNKFLLDHLLDTKEKLENANEDSKELAKLGIKTADTSAVRKVLDFHVSNTINAMNKIATENKDVVKEANAYGVNEDVKNSVVELASNIIGSKLYSDSKNELLGHSQSDEQYNKLINGKIDAFEQRLREDVAVENELAWDERVDEEDGAEVELQRGQEIDDIVFQPAEPERNNVEIYVADPVHLEKQEADLRAAEETRIAAEEARIREEELARQEQDRLNKEAELKKQEAEKAVKQKEIVPVEPKKESVTQKSEIKPVERVLTEKEQDTIEKSLTQDKPKPPAAIKASEEIEKVSVEKKSTSKPKKTKKKDTTTVEEKQDEKQVKSPLVEKTKEENRAERIEHLKRKIRSDLNNLNFGINPDTFAACVELTFYIVEDGVRSLKDVTKALHENFGEKILPYIKGIYSNVRYLPESAEFIDEMDGVSYIDSISDVSQFLVEEQPKPEISDSAVHDRLVQEKIENDKLPIPKGDVQADTFVTTEEDVVVPEELEEATGALPEERVEGDEMPVYEPLVYDPAKDPFSHKLKVFTVGNRKFQGYEDWEPGVELDKAMLDPDFLRRAETRVVVKDFNGEEAIYVEFIDGNKKYVAAVAANPTSMKNTRGGYVYSKEQGVEALREGNLAALRNKIIRISEWIKGTGNNRFKIIGTVATSNGRFTQNYADGKKVYTPLQQIKLFGIPSNLENVNESTVAIGIADGENMTLNGNIISRHGSTYGQTYLILDPKHGQFTPSGKQLIFSVDSAHFSEKMAKYIIKLMLLGNNQVPNTPFKASQLLKLIVHSGRRTIPTESHTQEAASNMIKKLLYNEYDNGLHTSTIISNYRFSSTDLQLDDKGNPINQEAYDTAVQLIMENMTWNINKNLLYEKLNKRLKSKDEKHPMQGVVDYMLNNKLDKLTLVPGELEFDAEDVGIVNEDGQYSIANPGINYLGWTIKNNRLVSDVIPDRPLADIWTYLQDVRVELGDYTNPKTEEVAFAPVEKVLEKEVERTITKSEAEEIVSKEHKKVDAKQGNLSDNESFDYVNKTLDAQINETATTNVESSEDDLFGAPMQSKNEGVVDIEAAKAWLAKTLGLTEEDETLVIVDDVITLMKTSVKAIGLTKEDCIMLYDMADKGVEFHEAWHRVSNLLISEKRRNKIYTSYRTKHKTDISDAALDEIFAEMFREFQLSKTKTIDYNTNNWFKKVVAFIKTLRSVSDYKIAKLYYDINMGRFKDVKPSDSNVARFRSIYGSVGAPFKLDGVEFEHINSTAMFNAVVENLKYLLLVEASQLSDVDEIKIAKVKRLIKNTARTSKLFQEVYEKFDDVFVPALNKSLNKMSIDLQQADEADAAQLMDSGDNVASSIQDHTVASYEKSKLEKVRPIVKFIFGTIPMLKYDVNGKVSFIPNVFTGLPVFYNMNKALNKSISRLSKCNSADELLNTVNKLAESSSFFRALKLRLNRIKDEQTWTQLLVTVRSNLMNFDTLRITTNRTDDRKSVKLEYVDNTADRKSYIYPRVWSEQFLNNSNIFQQDESGRITFTPDAVKDGVVVKGGRAVLKNTIDIYSRLLDSFIKNKPFVYNDVSYDLNDDNTCVRIKHLLVSMFNRLGVGITFETLEDVLNSSDYTKSSNMSQRDVLNAFFVGGTDVSRLSNFISLLNSILTASNATKNGDISIVPIKYGSTTAMVELNSIIRNSGFVINLAQYHAKNNMSDEESMAYGANGNKLYKISSNNTITQIVDDLNRSKDEVAKLMSTVYTKGSLILETLSTSKLALKVSTFVNFRENSATDGGRDYTDISPLEDYIAKMTAVFKDKIIFPTMADKKTYNFISGIPLFHSKVNYKKVNGKLVKTYGNDILDQMLKYAADDLAAIELCMEQLDPESDKYIEPNKRIKNYHTGSKNGLKFRTVTGIYHYKNGKEVFINFNDEKLTSQERIQLFKDSFYGNQISLQDKHAMLSTLLEKEIDTELKYAKNLGIIDYDYLLPDGTVDITKLRNVNLDTVELAERKERYSNLTKDDSIVTSLAIYDMIADYTNNSIVSVVEVEKVFSGDPAFYKGIIDKIKRLGGLISTGTDNRIDFVTATMADNTYSCAELNDVAIGYHAMDTLTSMFTVSDIRSALMSMEKLSAKEADELVSANVEVQEDGIKINEEFQQKYKTAIAAAKESAKKAAENYGEGINVTDASVYVSPKMYENMMRRIGNWNQEVQLAFRILTSEGDLFLKEKAIELLKSQNLESSIKYTSDGKAYLLSPANNWTSNPALYSMATKAALNALKYTAFGRRYQDGLAVPYYNKMAIFPLFKSIANGEAKKFYDRMTSPGNEVDMLMFNSAVKVGSQGSIDPFDDYKNGKVADLNELSVYRQDFKYLRQQFPTDPHEHMEQQAGTQMLKQGLSNLDLDGLYGVGDTKLSGSAIAKTIFSVMNELSNRAALEISNTIFNEDGSVNEESLAKMLLEDALSSNANDNIISGLKTKDGKFVYPLASMSDSSWLESRFIAYVNKKVIDIQLAGGTFIQRSPFGFRADSGLVVKEGFEYINEGKILNMVNTDGTMDAVISITMFKDVIPNYDKLTFEQARSYLFSMGIIGNDSKPAIGYRIPTQAISSISALKFVDVLPDVMGDTVILPEGFTKLTGSDYDVDKLFISRYEYGKTELSLDDEIQSELTEMFNSLRDESLVSKIKTSDIFKELANIDSIKEYTSNGYEVKLNKKTSKFYLIKGNERSIVEFSAPTNMLGEKALKNKLVDTYLKVLLTANKFTELKSSVDSVTKPVKDILEDVERANKKHKGSVLESYTPRFQEDKKQEYTTGKAGIGPMALNAAHHILTQLYNVRFRSTGLIKELGLESVYGMYDKYENEDGSRTRILDWLSAMINAFVDMAKDPYIIRLNVTPWTYNMTTLLLRTGVGKYTFYYLSQPILKEMSSEVAKYEGVYGIDSYKSKSELKKQAIKNILAKYDPTGKIYKTLKKQLKNQLKNGYSKHEGFMFNDILLPTEKNGTFLTRDLILDKNSFDLSEYNEQQVKMYVLFEALNGYSQDLADLVKYSKVDTKKTGKTLFEQTVFNNGVKEFKDESLFEQETIDRLFSESFLDTKIKNSIGLIDKILDGKLLRTTKALKEALNRILGSLNRTTIASDKLCSTISRSIEASIKSQFFADYMEHVGLTYEDILFGDESTAVKLLNIRNKIMSGKIPGMLNTDGSITNTLLDSLIPEISTVEDDSASPNFIKKSSVFDAEVSSADDMINSWRDLLDSDNAELKEFAEELVIYSFITSGDAPGSNSFFKYIPIEYKEKIGYNEFIKEQLYNLDKQHVASYDYDAIFRNNWFNNDLVKPVKFSEYKLVYDPISEQEVSFDNKFNAIMSDTGLGSSNTKYPILFTGQRLDGTMMNPIRVEIVDGQVEKYYSPYVKMRFNNSNSKNNTVIYKLIKYIGLDNDIPVYAATTKLGYKKDGFNVIEYGDCKFDEYSFDQTPEVISSDDNGIIDYLGDVVAFKDMLKNYKAGTFEYELLFSLLSYEQQSEYLNNVFNESNKQQSTDPEKVITTLEEDVIDETKAKPVDKKQAEIKKEPSKAEEVLYEIGYTPTGKSRQLYNVKGKPGNWKIFNKSGKEVFIGDSRDRNKILTNLAIKLKQAAIVSYRGSSYVVINNGNVVSIQTGSVISKMNTWYSEVLKLGNEKLKSYKSDNVSLEEEINKKKEKPSDLC